MSTDNSASPGELSNELPLENQRSRRTAELPSPLWRWFWLGLLLAAAPLLIPYFMDLWGNATYRYFPFALGSVCWLAYLRSDGEFYAPRGWGSWLLIALGLLLILVAAVLQFKWFAAVAFVCFGIALLYAMRGPEDESLLVLALPLLTVIQLMRADALLVRYLQDITTWMSSVFLDGMAVPHAVANNVIQLADRELFVAQACSGIQSVFTLGFLAMLVVAWHRRRIWMAPMYLLIACLLAVFANVIRVTVVALMASTYGTDLAQGWPHELLGYVALAIAFAFLLSFDYLVVTLLHRIPEESEFNPLVIGWNYFSLAPSEEEGGRSMQRSWLNLRERDQESPALRWTHSLINNRAAQITFVSIAGLLCLLSLSKVVMSRKPADLIASEKALVFDPPNDLINDSMSVMKVVNHISNRGYENPRLGANSDIWECEWDDVVAQFVISQPYQGWHELCDCYERLDWMLLDRDIRSPEDFETINVTSDHPDALKSTYVVSRFKRGPTQYGYLMFAALGSDGTLVDAPDSLSAFTHRVWNRIDNTGVWDQNEVIMLQMWLTVPERLKPRRLNEIEQDFIAVRARVAEAIAQNAGRTLPSAPSAPDAKLTLRDKATEQSPTPSDAVQRAESVQGGDLR